MEGATAFLDFMVTIAVDVSLHIPNLYFNFRVHFASVFHQIIVFSFALISACSLIPGSCPGNCTGNGLCLNNGICECKAGYTGIDCSTGKFYSRLCIR